MIQGYINVASIRYDFKCYFSTDGDRKAYYESSQWTMKKNKDTISKLREKNKRLRADLAKKKAVSVLNLFIWKCIKVHSNVQLSACKNLFS